jgi:putative ABC transport system substrate-binding protein
MNRRTFLRTFSWSLLAAPFVAEAQPRRIPRLCFITFDPGTPEAPSPRFAGFFQRLRELGYVHGQNITIEYLVGDSRSERFSEIAAHCVRDKADVIAVTTTPAAHAVKKATSTIPTVMVALGDPVGTGLVESLARPGGNLTGMSQMTSGLAAKRLELLKQAIPGISRVLVLTYLVDPIAPLQVVALKEAAPSLGITLIIQNIRTADDLPAAFDAAAKEHAQGLLTTAESIFRLNRAQVTELASRQRWPAVYPYAVFARESGGLMAYEISDTDLHKRAAGYVDKILRGAKPSELPIQQPTEYQLIINLKTAKALGLTIPPSLLLRADQVIE